MEVADTLKPNRRKTISSNHPSIPDVSYSISTLTILQRHITHWDLGKPWLYQDQLSIAMDDGGCNYHNYYDTWSILRNLHITFHALIKKAKCQGGRDVDAQSVCLGDSFVFSGWWRHHGRNDVIMGTHCILRDYDYLILSVFHISSDQYGAAPL